MIKNIFLFYFYFFIVNLKKFDKSCGVKSILNVISDFDVITTQRIKTTAVLFETRTTRHDAALKITTGKSYRPVPLIFLFFQLANNLFSRPL